MTHLSDLELHAPDWLLGSASFFLVAAWVSSCVDSARLFPFSIHDSPPEGGSTRMERFFTPPHYPSFMPKSPHRKRVCPFSFPKAFSFLFLRELLFDFAFSFSFPVSFRLSLFTGTICLFFFVARAMADLYAFHLGPPLLVGEIPPLNTFLFAGVTNFISLLFPLQFFFSFLRSFAHAAAFRWAVFFEAGGAAQIGCIGFFSLFL